MSLVSPPVRSRAQLGEQHLVEATFRREEETMYFAQQTLQPETKARRWSVRKVVRVRDCPYYCVKIETCACGYNILGIRFLNE